jgi:membrane protein YdbS with pleckstrin-like domain
MLIRYYQEPSKYRGIKEEQMAKKLKLYEKAGRVIRLMAWISGISVLAIAAAVIIPLIVKPQPAGVGPIAVVVIVLALIVLFVFFQLALGTAIKQHKEWGRNVGIAYGVLLLFGFPIGTIVGAYILYCLIKGWD